MSYLGLFTRHHVAILYDWLTQIGELFVYIDYPHSGGSGSAYFVRSLEHVRNLMSQQTSAEIQIHIFRAIVFPIRGNDYAALLQRALQEIPADQYYRIVTPTSYPEEIEYLADGKGHTELRTDLANLEPGQEIAIGVHPFDPSYEEFEQLHGGQVPRLYFEGRRIPNFYPELINNPDRYQDVFAQWFTSSELE